MNTETCCKNVKVSSLGYVIKTCKNAAQVVKEDGTIEWYNFCSKKDEKQIVDGDFVRIYKRKSGNYVKYALYFFSPKDVATAQVILDLGWQIQKSKLSSNEEANKLFLQPPCLEVRKQIE